MRDIKNHYPASDCRHRPVGKNTRLMERFRFWFIVTDYANIKHPSYTVGMVKCAKCGKVLRIPELYYSIPVNLLYLACHILFIVWEIGYMADSLRHNLLLFLAYVFITPALSYILFDRFIWFAVMHLVKWRSADVPPEGHKTFIQRESRRFTDDRRTKYTIFVTGFYLASLLLKEQKQWFIYTAFATIIGALIIRRYLNIRSQRTDKVFKGKSWLLCGMFKMDKRKRNWIIFFVILALVTGCITFKIITNSNAYLERKIQHVREDIKEFITEDDSQWLAVAKAIREEAQSRDDKTLYKSEYQTEFPKELDAQVDRMIANCPVKFDTVYVGGMTQFVYPEGCCVFRYTIEFDRGVQDFQQGVYAWVDLVYAPDCDTQRYRAFSNPAAQIIDDWYVIKFYGY